MGERRDARREPLAGEERRRQILDAAAVVFAKRGYHRARTREIAQQAGVAEGTIYRHFKSKEDLLISLVARVAVVSLPQLAALGTGGEPRSLLTSLLAAWLEGLDRNRNLLKAVVPEIISHRELREGYLRQVVLPTVNLILPLLQQHLQVAALRPFDARVAYTFFATGALGALIVNDHVDLPVGRRLPRTELVAQVVDLFLHGIQRRDADAEPARAV